MSPPTAFRRMIVGLPRTEGDYPLVNAAAKLAELLQLNVLALFADGGTLLRVAGISCVREWRAFGAGWSSIDATQLGREIAYSTATARRMFTQITHECRVEVTFQVEEGTGAETIRALAAPDDIVVVFEPRHPVERVAHQFTTLVAAAFDADASVLLVPRRIVRSSGPVVVVATSPHDPSLETALAIADAAHERLLLIAPAPTARAFAETPRATARVDVIPLGQEPVGDAGIAVALQRQAERLIVLTRGAMSPSAIRALASQRAVPVMIVEPADGGGGLPRGSFPKMMRG